MRPTAGGHDSHNSLTINIHFSIYCSKDHLLHARRGGVRSQEVGFEDRAKETRERAFICRNCVLQESKVLCTRPSLDFSDLAEFAPKQCLPEGRPRHRDAVFTFIFHTIIININATVNECLGVSLADGDLGIAELSSGPHLCNCTGQGGVGVCGMLSKILSPSSSSFSVH